MNVPAISVLMPAHNAERYIREAITSILDQSFKDFELIIVDDASVDSTWAIIQEYAKKDDRIVAVCNETNLKISATLNRALSLARGRYVARMDADDWSYPDRLAAQYAFQEAHKEIVVSGGVIEMCRENMVTINAREYSILDVDIRKKLFRYSPFCHATVIYQTEIARKIGGYNPDLSDAEDYDFYFRMGMYGKFGNLTQKTLRVRTHGSSMSMTHARRQETLTLYIRIKAVLEYGYRMQYSDKLYFILQYLSMFLIPPRLKFFIFNYLRRA